MNQGIGAKDGIRVGIVEREIFKADVPKLFFLEREEMNFFKGIEERP